MMNPEGPSATVLLASDNSAQIVGQLRQQIKSGQHWYLALLEVIEGWSLTEEVFDGQHFYYLIGGEAFDLLMLAERLCVSGNRFCAVDVQRLKTVARGDLFKVGDVDPYQ